LFLLYVYRDKYRRHVYFKRNNVDRRRRGDARSVSNSSIGSNDNTPFVDTEAKVLEWKYDAADIYHDYLDWDDTKKTRYLQKLLDRFSGEERDLQSSLSIFSAKKEEIQSLLSELHNELRDREHTFCLEIWSTIEAERLSRNELQSYTGSISGKTQSFEFESYRFTLVIYFLLKQI
jgi:hypothetical protein